MQSRYVAQKILREKPTCTTARDSLQSYQIPLASPRPTVDGLHKKFCASIVIGISVGWIFGIFEKCRFY